MAPRLLHRHRRQRPCQPSLDPRARARARRESALAATGFRAEDLGYSLERFECRVRRAVAWIRSMGQQRIKKCVHHTESFDVLTTLSKSAAVMVVDEGDDRVQVCRRDGGGRGLTTTDETPCFQNTPLSQTPRPKAHISTPPIPKHASKPNIPKP